MTSAGRDAPAEGSLLYAVRQCGDLLRILEVVAPGEVDDPAEVVFLDQLRRGVDAMRALVSRVEALTSLPYALVTKSWPTFSSRSCG